MQLISSLTRQFWRQKERYANLVLELQAFTILLLFALMVPPLYNKRFLSQNPFSFLFLIFTGYGTWRGLLSSLAIGTTILADLIFAGLMAWQNEKIDNSQTFQLLPLSTNQVWLVNLFASLLACAYLFIIQVVSSWLLSLPVMICDAQINPWSSLMKFLCCHSSWGNWPLGLIYLTGITLLIFILVTFVNYSSQTIVDFLPGGNSCWLRFVLIAVITVVGLYFALQINDHLTGLFIHDVYIPHKNGGEEIYPSAFWLQNIEVGAGILLFGGLDLWLGHQFWEPRRDR